MAFMYLTVVRVYHTIIALYQIQMYIGIVHHHYIMTKYFIGFFLYFLKFITVAYKRYKHAIMFLINYFFRVKFAYNENGRDVLKKIKIGINFSAHSIIQCTRNLHSVIFQYYIL